MSMINDILSDVSRLTSNEKLQLVDKILTSISPVNKGVDIVWGKEAEERLTAKESGDILTVDAKDLFSKYQKQAMTSVIVLELAQDELADTFEAFEYKQKNLGYIFVQEICNTIEHIKSHPDIWAKSSKNTQRSIIKNFSYSVIYQKSEDTIVILAIASLLKAPRYKISMVLSERRIEGSAQIPTNLYIR